MVRNSNNLVLTIDGEVVAELTSNNIDITRELIQVTKGVSNGNIERIPGVKDARLNFEAFTDLDATMYNVGDIVNWRFGDNTGFYFGSGIINSISYGGGTDDAPNMRGSVESSGQITFIQAQNQVLCIEGQNVCIGGETVQALV